MFTGIVQGKGTVSEVAPHSGLSRICVEFPAGSLAGLERGASIAIDGACLTVTDFDDTRVWFDVMMETLDKTTLGQLRTGDAVNYERAARIGDEIGGHLLSGHIHCTATLTSIETPENNRRLEFSVAEQWHPYLISKGYIAINGASLTIGEVDQGRFSVYLIPETLQVTTFGQLEEGNRVNIEIDHQTQTIVDTLARMNLQPISN